MKALRAEWERTLWESGEISLLLIDVDYFKPFNDEYGHQMGDDCLRAVGRALAAGVRSPSDLVARYGGEEFTVILVKTAGAAAAEVAERLRSAVENLDIPHSGSPIGRVTISIGAAMALSRAGGSIRMPEGLLTLADRMLYKAKHEHRNRVATSFLLAPETDGSN